MLLNYAGLHIDWKIGLTRMA